MFQKLKSSIADRTRKRYLRYPVPKHLHQGAIGTELRPDKIYSNANNIRVLIRVPCTPLASCSERLVWIASAR